VAAIVKTAAMPSVMSPPRFAQIHHEPLPLVFGEFSVELDGAPDADGQPDELARTCGTGVAE